MPVALKHLNLLLEVRRVGLFPETSHRKIVKIFRYHTKDLQASQKKDLQVSHNIKVSCIM